MTDQADDPNRLNPAVVAARRCPVCRKPAQVDTRPFCSRRCADVDLQRWMVGAYRIPVSEPEQEDGDGQAPSHAGSDEGHE